MDPHKLLCVEEGVSKETLDARWKVLCKLFHPDKLRQDATAVIVFQLLQEAYRRLSQSKDVSPHESQRGNSSRYRDAQRQSVQVPLTVISRANRARGDVQQRRPDANTATTTVGSVNTDPYFAQEFSLSDYFGDVSVRRE